MAGRGEVDAIDGFIDEFGVGGFPHVIDTSGTLWASFGVTSQPAWIFIDADGGTELHLGGLGEAGLTERIEALIG